MSHTLYATFATPEDAEKAAGALLDRGARAEDLSVVRHPEDGFNAVTEPRATASNVVLPSSHEVAAEPPSHVTESEDAKDHSASTTAEGGPATAAVHGTLIGAGIGAVVAIAALIVPGVGFVLGAGALASAIGGIAASAGTGAAAGAIVGYLKEMGVDEELATEYGKTVEGGGAVLALSVPSADLDEKAAEAILGECGATKVNRYAARM